MLAWTAGAVALMVAGGILALATWPRSPAPNASGVPPSADVAAAPADAMQRDLTAAGSDAEATTGAVSVVEKTTGAAPTGPADDDERVISPPPLPPLPPGLDRATPSEAPEAPSPGTSEGRQARRTDLREAPAPPRAPAAGAVPAPPAHDTRTSEEIMADFLVRSSGRAQAETTARAYSEWYAAGSRERAYWLGVLGAISRRR